jgi:hypothetical protein
MLEWLVSTHWCYEEAKRIVCNYCHAAQVGKHKDHCCVQGAKAITSSHLRFSWRKRRKLRSCQCGFTFQFFCRRSTSYPSSSPWPATSTSSSTFRNGWSSGKRLSVVTRISRAGVNVIKLHLFVADSQDNIHDESCCWIYKNIYFKIISKNIL